MARSFHLNFLLVLCLIAVTFSAVQDDAISFKYLHAHSQDMVVDYRNSWIQGGDTGRFKRDMQGGNNPDAHANEFWVIYKSRVGIRTFRTTLDFYQYANLPPEQDRSFYTSTNGVAWTPLTTFTESPNRSGGPGSPFFLRDYILTLPANTYFVQIKFADWVNRGSINYWTPQIHNVTYTELCDKCGNGYCGDKSSFGETENCNNCPQDCGACPKPVCGNGKCDFGESWAPRADGTPYTRDMGPLTCPEDCGSIETPGNLRCDPGEVCHSQTPFSCADCCPTTVFVVNQGRCGNGLCDGWETCTSCPTDCGACARCGDEICNGLETCRSCASDCGACPDPVTCLFPTGATAPPPPTPSPPTPSPSPTVATAPPPPTPSPPTPSPPTPSPPTPSPSPTVATAPPPPPPLNCRTIDDAVQGIGMQQWRYTGTWSHCNAGCAPNAYAGTDSITQTPGDSAVISFVGSQFYLYASVGNSRGNIAISIDGASPVVVSETAPAARGNVLVYQRTGLAYGTHTVTLSNPNTTPVRCTIDRVVVC